mgnify:CR=1 FL=1
MVVMVTGLGGMAHQAAGGHERQREIHSCDQNGEKDRPAFGEPHLHRQGFPLYAFLYAHPQSLSTDACSRLLQIRRTLQICVTRWPSRLHVRQPK